MNSRVLWTTTVVEIGGARLVAGALACLVGVALIMYHARTDDGQRMAAQTAARSSGSSGTPATRPSATRYIRHATAGAAPGVGKRS